MSLVRLVLLPARVAAVSLRLGFLTGRLFGYRRLVVFGAGVAVGLLLAPVTGRQFRQRLAGLVVARRPVGDDELAERVRGELARAPRTWHLPQPDVQAVAGAVSLRGEAPNEQARADLGTTAASVPGVLSVHNQVLARPARAGAPPPEEAPGSTPEA